MTGGLRSKWSVPVLAYPTVWPVSPGDIVGILPIDYYRPSKSYNYTLCTNKAPAQTVVPKNISLWRTIIKEAATKWSSVADQITISVKKEGICTGDELALRIPYNAVHIVKREHMERLTCSPIAIGCARPWKGLFGQVNNTRIAIYEEVGLSNDGKSCSELSRITIHEVGHAFGLLHADKSGADESVMNMPSDHLCLPTPYDVVAIMAIYQSR